MRIGMRIILLLAALAGVSEPASASLVRVEFSGTVDLILSDPANLLAGAISVGTPFAGAYEYDTTWASSAQGPTARNYSSETDGLFRLSIAGGVLERVAQVLVRVTDDPVSGDTLFVSQLAPALGLVVVPAGFLRLDRYELNLRGSSGAAFSSTALPVGVPSFESGSILLSGCRYNSANLDGYCSPLLDSPFLVRLRVDIDTLHSVPEPSTAALLAYGVATLASLGRRVRNVSARN